METYRYAVELEPDDNGTFLLTFPDFPEAQTFGETKEEALARGVDALATVMDAYISDRRDIPAPSRIKGLSVCLPALMATKVALYKSMRQQNVGKAELARRLNVHLPQVDRLVDVHHASRLDQLESAFNALGQRLEVSIVNNAVGGRVTLKRERPKAAAARTSRVYKRERRAARAR
jgi:antitoxin HicB